MAAVVQAVDAELNALERRIDIADRAADRPFFAHHVPRLQRSPQRKMNSARGDFAQERKAELEVWGEPLRIEWIARPRHLLEHVLEVEADERREHEAIMELRAPARELGGVRRAPEARNERA